MLLGLFDSGSGGINTVEYLRSDFSEIDAVYLIDRKNAPYGVRTENEIIEITKRNIDALCDMGAEKVLIACCTASTVYPLLTKSYRERSIPIISAAAKRAVRLTKSGNIGVLATERTVSSHAFGKAMAGCDVTEVSAQELVSMIDGGVCDKTANDADREKIERMLLPFYGKNIDTLVLGCTHFPSLKHTIEALSEVHGVTNIVDTAYIGALTLKMYADKFKD